MTIHVMTIRLNGTPREIATGTSVAQLLKQLTGSMRGSAVVVDDEVVPRGLWHDRILLDGQRVQLITAVQGG